MKSNYKRSLQPICSILCWIAGSWTVGSIARPSVAGTITNTKNVIVMIGDGMGWEMTRAAAIQRQINQGATGNSLREFYTSGQGTGLSWQTLANFGLVTTYGTTIAPANGNFSTNNSALTGSNSATGASPVRPGFTFTPTFNPGTTPTGGATNPNPFAVGNLVGYDPARGGSVPWDDAYYGGTPGSGFDREYIKHSYPDSANTATTLYTGVKSYNNAIGVDIFEKALKSTLAISAEKGKATGLVTSVPIDHATPGAAAANVNRRNKYDAIFPNLDNILQQELRIYQPTVLLGGGNPASNPLSLPPGGQVEPPVDYTYITRDTYDYLKANPINNRYGYTFIERGPNATQALLDAAALIDPDDPNGNRLLGLYGARGQNGNLPINSADGTYRNTGLDMFSLFSSAQAAFAIDPPGIPNPDTQRPLLPGETDAQFIATELNQNPRLKDLTQAALDVLGRDRDGFWLMVEGGDIDWAAHDNNLDNLIGATLDFNDSVQYVIDWINNNGGWEQNLLIVTADHDHYLTLRDNYPQLLQTVGAYDMTFSLHTPAGAGHFWGSEGATDPTGLTKYKWGNHTNRPVPVFYQGKGSEVLSSLVGQGFSDYGKSVPGIPGLLDQTHIAITQQSALETVPEPTTIAGLLGFSASLQLIRRRK